MSADIWTTGAATENQTETGRESDGETPDPFGSAPVAPVAPVPPVCLEGVLDDVRDWLNRFICTMTESDVDLLALWAAHTHLCEETYTSPRLLIDSPIPGSGKTTVCEHLYRLCVHPVQMASLSSPALLTRMLDKRMRTIIIDEADRVLDPDKPGIGDVLSVINSGYKRGATRPVLVPVKEGWDSKEMPTFSPVVMAGNNPRLPGDTMDRTIRVLLFPDLEGQVQESDWEMIEGDAKKLGDRLTTWADQVRAQVRANRPSLPEGIIGRARERWSPLKRVAVAAGGRWPDVVDALAVQDREQQAADREDGMLRDRPAVVLLKHLHQEWPEGELFVPTSVLIAELITRYPDEWGISSPFGKPLTAQRLGRMLTTAYRVNSTRQKKDEPRGYSRASFARAWHSMGIEKPQKQEPDPSLQTGGTGATGATGGTEGAHPKCRVCGHDLWAPQSQAEGICARCAQAKATS